jgi:chromate transporter
MGGGWMSVAGSLTATVAVALPSFAFVILAAKLFDKISHSALYEFSMRGVRPAVIGFLVSAVIFFGNLAFLSENGELNFWGPGICALCFFLNYKKQLGAIYIILISAAIGLAVF